MIEFENTEVSGWSAAIRGMRNPMNSWDKSDSSYGCGVFYRCNSCDSKDFCNERNIDFVIGENDLKLMMNLVKAGSDHSKFMRYINVTVDVTAPLYWWKEYDTYKVGTVRNSCSTMHKIHSKEFTMDDFSCEHLKKMTWEHEDEEQTYHFEYALEKMITALNLARDRFIETKDKDYWWIMIQLLPSSYNQKATLQMNYQVLRNIYHSDRKNHKLDEWKIGFMQWIESLPYSELITEDFRKPMELIEE